MPDERSGHQFGAGGNLQHRHAVEEQHLRIAADPVVADDAGRIDTGRAVGTGPADRRFQLSRRQPLTLRWVGAGLTVTMALYTRCILGLGLTPVSARAADVVSVIYQALCPRPGSALVTPATDRRRGRVERR